MATAKSASARKAAGKSSSKTKKSAAQKRSAAKKAASPIAAKAKTKANKTKANKTKAPAGKPKAAVKSKKQAAVKGKAKAAVPVKAAKNTKGGKKTASAKRPAVKRAAGKSAPAKPAPVKSAAPKPAAQKPAAPKPAAQKPAAQKPAAQKPAAQKPAAPKPAAPKPVAKPKANVRHGYSIKDFVVYPSHGVGRITAIEEHDIGDLTLRVFVVVFDKEKMTLRVPLDKAVTSGMRKLSSQQTMEQAISTLRGRARTRRVMWSRRAQEYDAKLNSGDPVSIAEVVRDLHRDEGQPDQSYSERQMYEAALERLAREFAAVEHTDTEQATEKLENVLRAA